MLSLTLCEHPLDEVALAKDSNEDNVRARQVSDSLISMIGGKQREALWRILSNIHLYKWLGAL